MIAVTIVVVLIVLLAMVVAPKINRSVDDQAEGAYIDTPRQYDQAIINAHSCNETIKIPEVKATTPADEAGSTTDHHHNNTKEIQMTINESYLHPPTILYN